MLPETGSISMSQVNIELKKSETSVITLNDTDVRKLAGKPSGVISMSDLRGKKNSEYVENYQIFSGSYESNQKSAKEHSFTIQIPKNIIKGKLILTAYKSGRYSNGGMASKININNIGSIDYIYSTNRSIETTKENFPKQQLSGNIRAGYGSYQSGSGSMICYINTTVITLEFTGEWEV